MLTRDQCTALLQWALPQLGLRWAGFRRVRGQVCKRIRPRLEALGLGADRYRGLLARDPAERALLDSFCRITISRFWRDRAVFDRLRDDLLPALAERARAGGERALRCWSAGCASGEEPWSLRLAFEMAVAPRFPGLAIEILATDVDPAVLARARAGSYPPGALRELPPGWAEAAFEPADGERRLGDGWRGGVAFRRQDLRRRMPAGPFHLVLCRNLAFTYFDETLQRAVLRRLVARLTPGGLLVVGIHERLPPGDLGLEPAAGRLPVYRRR
ncbi:MAG TPA: CheR family methyltransferase [Anaeromyxobacteraceae bacterium]|nr:CheR family methyltransferase [Anaeromyxobacteraceae bacterium]